MPKVICTLPNAAAVINGVAFEPHELGLISEDISKEKVEYFLSIPGYVSPDAKPAVDLDAEAKEIDLLRAEAAELGVEVSTRWKQDRLRSEIERAKEAAEAAKLAKE